MRAVFGLILFLGASEAGAVSVMTQADPNVLAKALVGEGITISSVSLEAATGASALFSDGKKAGLGFESGVLLSTGRAIDATGPNNDVAISTDQPGETDGAELVLRFRSTAATAYLGFVFASDEYKEFSASSAESVVLSLNGKQVSPLPNGRNVGLPTISQLTNTDLFVENEPKLNTLAPFDVQYDGFTKRLSLKLTGLSLNKDNTLRIVMRDDFDELVDSAVFLQKGSLSTRDLTPVSQVPAPPAALLLGSAVAVLGGLRRRRASTSRA